MIIQQIGDNLYKFSRYHFFIFLNLIVYLQQI